MEIDAGLWMLLACTIGFITLGCKMTAPKMALRNLNSGARNSTPHQH
jgi:hypothetical protein